MFSSKINKLSCPYRFDMQFFHNLEGSVDLLVSKSHVQFSRFVSRINDFSSNFDLYHTGSLALDTTTTVEAWLNNLNAKYNFSLPVFGPQVIDTTRGMSPQGVFSKEWDQSIKQKSIRIEYGMSDEITLSVKIPMIDSYVMNQSFFDYSVKPILGAQILVDYHQNVKNDLFSHLRPPGLGNIWDQLSR